ncbi:MAG TPA: hypothetical protein VJJ52_00825 [Candidatus Nanoarchaeia archaeon]|nr:hypothetical protein [Candidatus Nanoarchaeia archaeon]
MQNLSNRLEKRGWSAKEIEKAVGIIDTAKKVKTSESRFLEKRIYFVLLLLIVAANFIVSVALIPILIVLKGAYLYFIITVLGITFGLLFELVIRSIEHLERRHHLVLAFFIPIAALINAVAISQMSNKFESVFGINNFHEPLFVGLVYAVSFVLPYIVYRFVLKIEYYVKE